FLMRGVIAAELWMSLLGITKIDAKLLAFSYPALMLFSLPILVVSFGFQNMIPGLTSYFHGDLKKVRWTILGGSLSTLLVYLVWSILVLGVVPQDMIQESY